jgi:hypothetical protein|tara:strand:- start:1001 stop:1348 length:348 start_codon:yes stop_codon:yes gene_type:complete
MSRIVRVLSIKTINREMFCGSRSRFIDYTNKLSETAKYQKGFISSESFWKNDIYDFESENYQIISISNWTQMKYWNKWYSSYERKFISNKFNELDCKEEFNILLKKENNDDIFLL